MLCFALVCGGLAASEVHERERRAAAAVGPLVPVVVAQRDLAAERRLRAADLAVKRLPDRFVPPDALGERELVAGARVAVPVVAGSYLTASMLQGAESANGSKGSGLRPGQRAVALRVAGGGALAGAAPGSRVDVVVSSQPGAAGGRTYVALEDVELLALGGGEGAGWGGSEGGGADGADGAGGAALATLRVTARQAVYLTAAANFANEIRLLVRPPGDRRRIGAVAVPAGGL
jgi:pilus assembly protein CpaB